MQLLTRKKQDICSWLRPTQFKPRLHWVGSAAQVRRYCVGSAAQAFIHALAGCIPRSLQPRFAALAIRGPRILRPTRLMFSQPMSFLGSHNLVPSDRVKTVHSHLLRFLTLIFSHKVKTTVNIPFICIFGYSVNHWGSVTHICADHLCHSLHRYVCR